MADKITNNWCILDIPESIVANGDKQYKSKLLDLVYEYLDIRGLIRKCLGKCSSLSSKVHAIKKPLLKFGSSIITRDKKRNKRQKQETT